MLRVANERFVYDADRHISDTALWAAVYRAREGERGDVHFRDRYASKLAGDRGTQIAAAMPFAQRHAWSYVARTWLVDQVIEHEVRQRADMGSLKYVVARSQALL
jgi:O-methyltransferase involved in polyketide biosynthesis